MGDAGEYTGCAENRAGRAEFRVQLNVLEKEHHVPPKFTDRIRGVDVSSGQDIILTCSCTGNPAPSLAWTKDNKYINNDDRHRYVYSKLYFFNHLCLLGLNHG